jgi:hypothetical protein
MKRVLSIAVATLLLSQVSFAQEGPMPPKPGPEHEILKDMEGTWDTVMTMAGAPKDAPASKGKTVSKMEIGGLWLTSKFEGDFAGAKFEGRGIDGYDQTKKKYTAMWVDSMTTTPLILEGTYDAKAKSLTMIGDFSGPDGKPAKFKIKSVIKDKDHHTSTMSMIGEDKMEQEMFSIEYTRKK